jgi:ubiquinone/menaquinone biosynthesis C-methylase UbiE
MQELATRESAEADNADRVFYEAETHYFDDPAFTRKQLPVLESYRAGYRNILAEFAKGRRRGLRTLELGAGSCLTSLLLSKEPWIESMHCVDISAARMEASVRAAAPRIGGRVELLTFGEADFSHPLTGLADGAYDVVLFDAALHHTRNMWLTLQECRRVLVDDGLLVAQRELYLARFTSKFVLRRALDSREVRSGVSENAYLREQYDYYLRAVGFRPRFIAAAPGRLRWISLLNGLVFSKWTIVAERRPEAPVVD